jgi:hypothetical protein
MRAIIKSAMAIDELRNDLENIVDYNKLEKKEITLENY